MGLFNHDLDPVSDGCACADFCPTDGTLPQQEDSVEDEGPAQIVDWKIPEDADLRDVPGERELRWRDQAHFWSYHVLNLGILWVWILIFQQRQTQIHERAWPELAVRHPWITDNLLFGVAAILLFAALTLPDSIILWFMPDLEEKQ